MVMRRRQKRREKNMKACLHCQRSFEARANAGYCSHRCRAASWRERERQMAKAKDRKVRDLLEEAIEVLSEGEDLV